MIIRDTHFANHTAIIQMMHELVAKERTVATFLLDMHPTVSGHVSSDVLIGLGWDTDPPPGRAAALRWLGDRFSPAGLGSSLVHDDPEVAMVLLSNALARRALQIEIKTKGPAIWVWGQPHIKTPADAEKLWRYMNHYSHSFPALH